MSNTRLVSYGVKIQDVPPKTVRIHHVRFKGVCLDAQRLEAPDPKKSVRFILRSIRFSKTSCEITVENTSNTLSTFVGALWIKETDWE